MYKKPVSLFLMLLVLRIRNNWIDNLVISKELFQEISSDNRFYIIRLENDDLFFVEKFLLPIGKITVEEEVFGVYL